MSNVPLSATFDPREKPTVVVWALAWPAVALNSLQVINTLLDRFFLRELSESAYTGHGAAINTMFLMFSIGIAIATGATAIVSRAFGAGNIAEYRMACNQSVRVALFAGLLGAVFTWSTNGLIAGLLLPAEDLAAQREMKSFIAMYALGLPALFLVHTLAGCLRGVGDTKSPMWISGFQILLHIALNYVLIPRFGLAGAAMSLSGSAFLAAAVYTAYMPRTPLGGIHGLHLPRREWVQRVMNVATPAAVMSCLRVFSLTAFTLILKDVPDSSTAIAAMSIGFAIESVLFMPSFGLSMAAGALVGQSLGMNRADRAERLAWTAGHHGGFVAGICSIPLYLYALPIAETLVGNKPGLAAESAHMIQLLCLTEVPFAYAVILMGAMQGAGETRGPLWITVFSLWGLRVPLAWMLAVGLVMGSSGAWVAMSATQAVQGLLSAIVFRRGRWKSQEV